jgi:hypothetical protein
MLMMALIDEVVDGRRPISTVGCSRPLLSLFGKADPELRLIDITGFAWTSFSSVRFLIAPSNWQMMADVFVLCRCIGLVRPTTHPAAVYQIRR